MLTFDDHIDVWSGDTKIELHYIGTPAHTTNDVVAWLPERKILFAGDLVFNGGTPFVVMGSVEGSLDADRAAAPLRARRDRARPRPGVRRRARSTSSSATTASCSTSPPRSTTPASAPLDAARDTDLGEFAELTDPERLVGNLHRALFERRGGERGGRRSTSSPRSST